MATPESTAAPGGVAPFWVALTGNPNCGKTTLFNALTGLRAKVGNYAGVTVERKEGQLTGADPARPVTILDLPGTYSLSPQSLDEAVARDILFARLADAPAPALVVIVVDASNLQRNLYYATQVIELGYPTFVALNMVDVARERGEEIDAEALSRELGTPVFPLVASEGGGVPELRRAIIDRAASKPGPANQQSFLDLPGAFQKEVDSVAALLAAGGSTHPKPEAVLLLSDSRHSGVEQSPLKGEVDAARARIEAAGLDWRSAPIESRYAAAAVIQSAVTTTTVVEGESFSDRLDQVLTHRVWGLAIFVLIMAVMFQSIFVFAQAPMDLIKDGVDWLASRTSAALGPGDLQSLLADGVIKGVGAVIVFLPQICLLFLFISLLEDTGYMARAAFLMDRLMSRVGLHGKSFIPMLSSFACAIPGIMATRTIESSKDRLVTILVAPLMSCSARLPVYTVLIGACIPRRKLAGFIGAQGLTLLAMYLIGIVGALTMAWIFKRTLLRGETPPLILELPPYKRPVAKTAIRHMWDRSHLFLRRAGTVILGINVLLWFLVTYPRQGDVAAKYRALQTEARQRVQAAEANAGANLKTSDPKAVDQAHDALKAVDDEMSGALLRGSFAGRLGQCIEPVLRPLGFDWKIGVGIVASFAAREVFVSTMSVVYNIGRVESGDEKATSDLEEVLRRERRPDGSILYTPLTGVTLMIFYVFAMQCVSTVAVVRRETNSWRWPAFQWAYMTGLAWVLAFAVRGAGHALGFQ
jgi:ferrous iron transport protein B